MVQVSYRYGFLLVCFRYPMTFWNTHSGRCLSWLFQNAIGYLKQTNGKSYGNDNYLFLTPLHEKSALCFNQIPFVVSFVSIQCNTLLSFSTLPTKDKSFFFIVLPMPGTLSQMVKFVLFLLPKCLMKKYKLCLSGLTLKLIFQLCIFLLLCALPLRFSKTLKFIYLLTF